MYFQDCTVHCTAYNLLHTVELTAQCTSTRMYSVSNTLEFTVHCTLQNLQRLYTAVCTVQRTLKNLQRIVQCCIYSVSHTAVFTVHCTVTLKNCTLKNLLRSSSSSIYSVSYTVEFKMFRTLQGNNARNINCCCEFSAYMLKLVLFGLYLLTRIDASVFLQYPQRIKAFHFDNLHNSLLYSEYFIDFLCERRIPCQAVTTLFHPSCVYFIAQKQYTGK